MLRKFRFALLACGLAAFGPPVTLLAVGPASAQDGDQGAPQQVALTQKQVDDLVASQADMNALQAKAQPSNSDQPDPKLQSKVEAIAKKNGFTGLEQYEAVTESVGAVMMGIDPETKTYVGPNAVIKKQIAQVQADRSMPARDKSQALKELKEAMATSGSVKPPAGNIELVSKNFDKLSRAFQGAGGE